MKWFGWFVALSLLATGCQQECNASNCEGCCAEDGSCAAGTSRFECGEKANRCVRCANAELCLGAVCVPRDAGTGFDAGSEPVDGGCGCATACCLADGSCGTDNDATACGTAKRWCAPCAEGQRCENGLCVSASCNGCWTPLGQCVAGTSDDACGLAGMPCKGCLANSACRNGACVSTRCDETTCRFGCCQPDLTCVTTVGVETCGLGGDPCVACGVGQQCIGGTCQ